MARSHDIAIVGLGAMGSAAAYHLSKRGKRVIGFDLATPPHALGSTHGESRVIRAAYFEHPVYVPLVQRAYEGWYELEAQSGVTLLLATGGLLLGPRDGALVGGSRLSADRHGLDYEILSARDIRKRYPPFQPADHLVGMWEPQAGILLPELCVDAYLNLAAKAGATLRFNEPVSKWMIEGDGCQIVTQNGDYNVSQLLLAPGAWMSHFVPDLRLPLTVERQVLYWFEPAAQAEAFERNRFPLFGWEYSEDGLFYGFPNLGGGVKVALHHQGVISDVESIDREVAVEEVGAMRALIGATIPDLDGGVLRTEVCMYTNTPDEHFIIDFHPQHPQVLLASACSGHGFKFTAAMGSIVADLLIDGRSDADLSPFSVGRLIDGDHGRT